MQKNLIPLLKLYGDFSHCGIDAFQLFKDDKGEWKITQIVDTRRKEGCGI